MDRNRNFLANWENWPRELEAYALPHKKKTMFFVDGPHDIFDNIVMTLWMKRGQKCSVLAGINWRYSWNGAEGGVVAKTGWENDRGEGHCINFKGVKYIDGAPYLVAQNSWGTGIGDRGMFYFPREVVNSECANYGQITFEDMDKETAKYFLLHDIKLTDNRFKVFIKLFISTIKYILK